jgi:hypothetical protein
MQYGSCRPNGNKLVLSQFDFKPHPTIVGNGNRGPSQHHIVGGPWGLYGIHNALSSNVVLSSACKLCGDAVFLLQVNREGAFEGCTFILTRDCNSWPECGVSPVSRGS